MPILRNQDTKSSRSLFLAKLRLTLRLRKWDIKVPKTIQVIKEILYDNPGHLTPEREAMPCSEQWGVHGWSFADRDDARRKFYELVSVKNARRRDDQGIRFCFAG